jgi:hypothetical protein
MPDIQEDVMRELMRDATADLHAPRSAAAGAIRHVRRRQLRNRLIGAGAAAAVAGLAVGVIVTTSSGGAGGFTPPAVSTGPLQLTAAQQALYSLSDAAAGSHNPAGRFVIMTEKTVSGAETGQKTSVIDTATGAVITYQDISLGASPVGTPRPPAVLRNGPGTMPAQAQLDAMPTSPGKLKAELLAQAKQQIADAQQKLRGQKPGAGPVSKSSDNDLVFTGATDLLWQPNLSPALRAALYKVLASTPGVKVSPHARDDAGRPAVKISRVLDWGSANVIAYENPKTGATLETASQLTKGSGKGQNVYKSTKTGRPIVTAPPKAGDLDADVYLSIKYANSIPGNPYRH